MLCCFVETVMFNLFFQKRKYVPFRFQNHTEYTNESFSLFASSKVVLIFFITEFQTSYDFFFYFCLLLKATSHIPSKQMVLFSLTNTFKYKSLDFIIIFHPSVMDKNKFKKKPFFRFWVYECLSFPIQVHNQTDSRE